MFEYTDLDLEKVKNGYFISFKPLKLRQFPPKQKKKFIVLNIILKELDSSKIYTEKDLNKILENIYPDFVLLRRGMIDFRLMEREKDCSKYWVISKD